MMSYVWWIAYDGTAAGHIYIRTRADEVGPAELTLRDTLTDEVRTPWRCRWIDISTVDKLSRSGCPKILKVVESDTQECAATVAWVKDSSGIAIESPFDKHLRDMLARIKRP
jgi:hypothetical protein